jgi:hypothetical protein
MFLPDLRRRVREAEWMDRPDADVRDLWRSLRFIRHINVALRYTRATIGHLQRFSKAWPRGRTIRMIDFATGSADIPRAILRWGDSNGFQVQIVGIDLHPLTAQIAVAGGAPDPRLNIVRADATSAPFADGSFDYALTAMFLHHLDDDQAVTVLREMDRVAARGIIAADLLRNRRAYAWISLLTLGANPIVRHDARVSVAQAFTRDEVLKLGDRAGVGYATYFHHFAHRFVLAGEKTGAWNGLPARV